MGPWSTTNVVLLPAFGQRLSQPAALGWLLALVLALSPNNPHAPMGWGSYLAAVRKLQRTTALLDAPSLEQLLQFSRQRRMMLAEMHTLQSKLDGEVQLPSLAPLDEHLQHLDEFVARVTYAKALHLRMLQRDLGQLQLGMLEIKLKIDMGFDYQSSEECQLVERVKLVCCTVLEHGHLPKVEELEQLREQLQQLVILVQARKGARTKPTLSNVVQQVALARS